MTVRIQKETFFEKGHKTPAPGLIRALSRMIDHGYTLSTNSPLPEVVAGLLAAEQITLNIGAKNPEAEISGTADHLKLTFTDREIKAISASDWVTLSSKWLYPVRKAKLERKTSETEITVSVNLDGQGKTYIETGLSFFDHMLDQIGKHGGLDLTLKCTGDLHVDEHHTIEDVAIALGEVIQKALPDKRGIGRYGFILAMDESQARVALDLSNRPYLVFDAGFKREKVGDFPTEMTEHFFYSLAMSLKATLQMSVDGSNDHHKIEALFKGFAKSLRQSLDRNARYLNVLPSSKGKL